MWKRCTLTGLTWLESDKQSLSSHDIEYNEGDNMILREEVEQVMKQLKDQKSQWIDETPASRANQSRRTSIDQRDTQIM